MGNLSGRTFYVQNILLAIFYLEFNFKAIVDEALSVFILYFLFWQNAETFFDCFQSLEDLIKFLQVATIRSFTLTRNLARSVRVNQPLMTENRLILFDNIKKALVVLSLQILTLCCDIIHRFTYFISFSLDFGDPKLKKSSHHPDIYRWLIRIWLILYRNKRVTVLTLAV